MSGEKHAVTLQPIIPTLAIALAATAAAMWWGARSGQPLLSALAAATWVVAIIGAGLSINGPVWRAAAANAVASDELRAAARRNARLVMLNYAWGAAALLAVYGLTPLKWQHGKQYALGMALIAGAILYYVRRLEKGSALAEPAALQSAHYANLAHGLAAAGGLVFLVNSGKLWAGKGDWAANHVFLAGGLAVIAVTVLAALTHAKLSR